MVKLRSGRDCDIVSIEEVNYSGSVNSVGFSRGVTCRTW